MDSFLTVLTNVLITLFFLIPGFILKKMNRVSEAHLSSISAILVYIGTPFLEVSAFLSLDFDLPTLGWMWLFFLLTFALQAAFMALVRLFPKNRQDPENRMLVVSSVMGNVGFFGAPLIRAAAPDALCYVVMYMLSMNVLVFSFGTWCITGEKKYLSVKALLLNPTAFGFVLAFPCFLFGLKDVFPAALTGAIDAVANMTTPLCMFILGIRLASAPLGNLLRAGKAFLAAALKLVAFPLFCFALTAFFPLPRDFRSALLILSAAPCATLVMNLAEMYRGKSAFAANCLFLSTLLCFLTIPALTLLA